MYMFFKYLHLSHHQHAQWKKMNCGQSSLHYLHHAFVQQYGIYIPEIN